MRSLPLIIVVGVNDLALRVCEDLCATSGHGVLVLWEPHPHAEAALGLDVYAWWAQRLRRAKTAGDFVSWGALKAQFGPQYEKMAHFRRDFLKVASAVKEQYPGAKVSEVQGGFMLYKSEPPVPPRFAIVNQLSLLPTDDAGI